MIGAASKFKRGTGRDAHVVLIPQPSDDPNDPYVSSFYPLNWPFSNHYRHRLNWPRWKKEACFWTLYVVLSTERPLSNKFITQDIRCSSGRGTRAFGQPRLCASVEAIRGKHRRSVVLLWVNRVRIGMFHVSIWWKLYNYYLTRKI